MNLSPPNGSLRVTHFDIFCFPNVLYFSKQFLMDQVAEVALTTLGALAALVALVL